MSVKPFVLLILAAAAVTHGCAPTILSTPGAYTGMTMAELLENIEQDDSHDLCLVSEDRVFTVHTTEWEWDEVHTHIFNFGDDGLTSVMYRQELTDDRFDIRGHIAAARNCLKGR